MIFSVPSDWVEISKEQFDNVTSCFGESREGFSGAIVYYATIKCVPFGKCALACVLDDGRFFCDRAALRSANPPASILDGKTFKLPVRLS